MVGKILDQVRAVMSLLNERDQSQMVRITATVSPEPIPVTVSKFGGVPYLPEGVDAPTNADGDPLGMIAQINCAELPDNDVYPKTGIVQFWLNLKDDQWGMNFDNPIAQDNTRVTYYPEVGPPDTKAALPQIDWEDVGWPIYPENVELALSFEVIQQGDVILSEDFFDAFVDLAPAPAAVEAEEGVVVQPTDERFTGFIFKIQANMNPAHRDRIAFVRICSGKFEQGMNVTLNRTKRTIRMAHTTQFMADTREEVQEAVAGDIIGLYDTGNLQIGDTLYTGNAGLQFKPLPQFTPELFMKVTPKNVMKQKSFHKGIEQLVQEGAIQLYKTYHTEEYIIGAVGQLQFEVFQYRLLHEYNAEVDMTPIGNKIARWIDEKDLNPNMSSSRNLLAKDRFGQPVFLFENAFAENWFKDKYPDIELKKLL